MNTRLRYEPGQQTPPFPTVFRFHRQDILQHAEQCNGSGDCRKTHLSGGTMCPSFMATRNEKDTTRARANILREFLTRDDSPNRYDHKEIYEVMDLCLSCKGCKSECPSNVDVAKLKAEFLQHYYDANGVPLRTRLIAGFTLSARLGSLAPGLYNGMMRSALLKKLIGLAPDRSMPTLYRTTLRKWWAGHQRETGTRAIPPGRRVHLFCDEFTNYNDVEIGIKTILLLETLGYEVILPDHLESGRTWLSKGLIRKAKKIAGENIRRLLPVITEDAPLIGIEPSAILAFRDEYPDLADDDMLEDARRLAANSWLIDDFLAREIDRGHITAAAFTSEKREVLLHGHCQQKALSSVNGSVKLLSLPRNYTVSIIPSGCCGMAGSFGYEKEHYALSQQIGELVLLPAVRNAEPETILAAPGTSCRHQIRDGTGRKALHPVEVLFEALVIEPGNHTFAE
jgi:Fe-S oxidoreductase